MCAALACTISGCGCGRFGKRDDARAAPAPSAEGESEASGESELAAAPAEAPPPAPLNVILIVIDSLRADMPWKGYPRPIAPRLSELEKNSVSYHRAYAVASMTARSMGALLAGKYPSEMPRTGFFFTTWLPENELVSERLQKAGRRTLAVHGHPYFGPGAGGLNQGYDDYAIVAGTPVFSEPTATLTSARINERAKEMLSRPDNVDQKGDRRFFMYVQYMDPHAPYVAHQDRPSFGTRPRDLYDQEVHYTDQHVGELIDWAKAQPWGKQTAFIVTADHGECFGEHGHVKHGYELWEELVNVPLIVHAPGAEPRRIQVPRSHIDLAPTILELMGVASPPELRGESLVPEIRGAKPEPRVVTLDLPRDDLQHRRRAVIDGDHKLIVYGDEHRFLLFDLKADPREEKDLSSSEPELLERMNKIYGEISESIPNEPVRGDVPPLRGAPEGRRW